MSFRSQLYVGSVMHRRLRPCVHQFRYRAFWLLLDLDELPRLSDELRLFSHNRPNVFSLYNADHGDGTATPLRQQVERQLATAGLDINGGRIALMCMPRTLGYVFNPLSIYFCYDAAGAIAALVYQVHNTFGDHHSYVIAAPPEPGAIRQHCDKSFYVSPFMDMNLRYEFRVAAPAERVAVGIRAHAAGERLFNAALAGSRRDLSDRALMRLALTVPAVTMKVMAAIHWEALRLWLKGARYRPRPSAPAAAVILAGPGNTD